MKRIFLLVMLCIMVSSRMMAQYVVDKLTYIIKDDGTAAVSKNDDFEGDVNIPPTVVLDGMEYTVTAIEDYAFAYNNKIANVKLPATIITIGKRAFEMSSMTSIYLPYGLKEIGQYSFYQCELITELIIPGSVEELGDYFCDDCYRLKNLVFEEGITKIPSGVGCSSYITTLKIPSTVNEISSYAFSGSSLTSIEIPENVTKIGNGAFKWSVNLVSVKLPETLTEIENNMFAYCRSLEEVNIPQGVLRIEDGAFKGCEKLTKNIKLPDNLIEIGDNVFYGCPVFNGNHTIPQSLEKIGGYSLTRFSIPNIVVPPKIKNISEGAFAYIHNVVSVEIHDEVENIDAQAFAGIGMENIVIPKNVKSIGDYAFKGCRNLKTVSIPHSVTDIGEQAFAFCTNMHTIFIGASVQTIGESAFAFCSSLKDMYCFAKEVPYTWRLADDMYGDPFLGWPLEMANPTPSTPVSEATLHVWESSLEDYKKREHWGKFGHFAILTQDDVNKADEESVTNIPTVSDGFTFGNDIFFDLSGHKTNSNHKGIIIKNGKKMFNRKSKQ